VNDLPQANRWHGWLWQGGRWVRVCAAATLATAARLLAEAGRARRVPERHQLLTGSSEPPAFVPPSRKQRCRTSRKS
jgi:hypothetical protein